MNEPLYLLSKDDVDFLRKLRRKVDGINGPGVLRNDANGIVIGGGAASSPSIFDERAVRVKLDSPREGKGFYKAYLWLPPTDQLDSSSDLTEAMLGVQGPEVTVASQREMGANAGWRLLLDFNAGNTIHNGYFNGTDTEGRRVVVLDAEPPMTTLIKVTGSAAGGGTYTATSWYPYTAGKPDTGDLAESNLGYSGVVNIPVRALNTREVGLSTHKLSSSGYLPLIFLGIYVGTAADGVMCYAIDGRQGRVCT